MRLDRLKRSALLNLSLKVQNQAPCQATGAGAMCTRDPSLSAGAEQACDRAAGDTLRQCSSLAPSNTQALRELRELWNDINNLAPALALTRHAVTTRLEPHGKSTLAGKSPSLHSPPDHSLAGKSPSLHSPPDHFRRTRGYELHGYGRLTTVPETYVKLSHAKQTEQGGAHEVTEKQKHTGTRTKARAPQTPASSSSLANFPSAPSSWASGRSTEPSFSPAATSRASGRITEPSSKLVARRASRTASAKHSRTTVTPPNPRSKASAPRTVSAPSSTQAGQLEKARRAARERETTMQTRNAPAKAPRDEYARNCAGHHHVQIPDGIQDDERESHAEMVTESDNLLFWRLFVRTMITFLSVFVVLPIIFDSSS